MNRKNFNDNYKKVFRKVKVCLLAFILLGVLFSAIEVPTAKAVTPKHSIGTIFLEMHDFLGIKWWDARVEGSNKQHLQTDSEGKIIFYALLDYQDQSSFNGAYYLAWMDVYKRETGTDDSWDYVDKVQFEYTSGDWEKFHRQDDDAVDIEVQLDVHQPYMDFKFLMGGFISCDGGGSAVDTDYSYAYDTGNSGYEPYQQVIDVNKPPTSSVGSAVTITGDIHTEDGYGEPVSDTQVTLFITVENENPLTENDEITATEEAVTTTDENGNFQYVWNIPSNNRYGGSATVYAYDSIKSEEYLPSDGDSETFYIMKDPDEEDIRWQVLELDAIPDARIGDRVTITGNVVWYYTSGGTSNPSKNAPVEIGISIRTHKINGDTTTNNDGDFTYYWDIPPDPSYMGECKVEAFAKEHGSYTRSKPDSETFTIRGLGGEDPPSYTPPDEWPFTWVPGYFLLPGFNVAVNEGRNKADEIAAEYGVFILWPYIIPPFISPAPIPPYVLEWPLNGSLP
jgi:hypothetical protein